MVKVIFFDVDGTLLSHSQGKVPQSTVDALQAVRKKGIRTILATGRHMIELSKLPVIDLEFDGYLTLNGQLILDKDRNVYKSAPIDPGEMEIVSRIFQAKKVPFVLIGEQSRYINYVDGVVVDTQSSTRGTIPDIGQYQGEPIYQCLAFVPKEKQELLREILDECSITSWNATGIDIISKGGGKARGIQLYLEDNGIDVSEAMAFGDGENDVEMLRFVGTGVAMGNASDYVKSHADYVTNSVDHDGIANALRHFGLIED